MDYALTNVWMQFEVGVYINPQSITAAVTLHGAQLPHHKNNMGEERSKDCVQLPQP